MNTEGPSRRARSRDRDRAVVVPVLRSRGHLAGDSAGGRVDPGVRGAVNGVPGAGSAAVLSPERLLAAISGHLDTDGAPVLVGLARDLGELRAALPAIVRNPARPSGWPDEVELRRRIATVVADIDTWRVRYLPHRTGVRTHTHSLGQAMDQVATRYADARWTALHSVDRRLRRRAWFHLGQAREGYAHLVADIRAGRVELPQGWSGFRRAAPMWSS